MFILFITQKNIFYLCVSFGSFWWEAFVWAQHGKNSLCAGVQPWDEAFPGFTREAVTVIMYNIRAHFVWKKKSDVLF